MSKGTTFNTFRKIAKLEGISYLVLLLIAMPLKYIGDMPIATTIAGSIHGLLFISFIVWMYLVYDQYGTTLQWMFKAFLASIVPFGTFIMDREWKKEMKNEK